MKTINNNNLVKEYVTLHTTKKTIEDKMTALKNEFLDIAKNENCTFYYKGVENITSCVTVSSVTKKQVKAGNEKAYNELQAKIDALKAQQEELCETVFSHNTAKVTKAPKGLNNK